MKVAIASDHAGFLLKQEIIAFFEAYLKDISVIDKGTDTPLAADYPDYGDIMAGSIIGGEADLGIIICGSGNGIAMAANRHKGVRAAVCRSGLEARLARAHNDANVLALGARISGIEVVIDCVKTFLETPFEGGRHVGRVSKLG